MLYPPARKTCYSTWFGHHCTQIGVNDPQLVLHSFRHGFVERLFKTHGVEEANVKAVVGHAIPGESHESYFRGYATRVLAETVGALACGIEDELRAQFADRTLTAVRTYPTPRARHPNRGQAASATTASPVQSVPRTGIGNPARRPVANNRCAPARRAHGGSATP